MGLRTLFTLTFFLCALFGAQQVRACDPYPAPSGSSGYTNYNPFDSSPATAQLEFSIFNDSDTTCDLEIDLMASRGNRTLDGPGKKLDFEIVNSGGWSLNSSGKTLATINRSVSPNQTLYLTISFRIPINQVSIPGQYSEAIHIDVFDTSLGSKKNKYIISSTDHDLTANIESRVEARVSSSSGNYGNGSSLSVMDFGILESNMKEDMYLQLRGNTDASVTVSSLNNGSLQNTRDVAETIDYTLRFGNNYYNLSAPFQESVSINPQMSGKSVRMRYIIGSVDGKLGGLYKDTLNITVNAY